MCAKIDSIKPQGTVSCTLTDIPDRLANSYGTLHGGAIASLVDIVGTLALLSQDPLRGGVSVDLNVSYCAAAKVGQPLTITGRCLKLGGRLGFTEVEVRTQTEERTLIATGRHTKAM